MSTYSNSRTSKQVSLQSTKELIKYSDSILKGNEGEFLKVQNLLTAKPLHSNASGNVDNETVILTHFSDRDSIRASRMSHFTTKYQTGKSRSNSTDCSVKSKTVEGSSIHEGTIEVRAIGKRSSGMFGRSNNKKISSKFNIEYVRIFAEHIQPGTLSALVVRFLIYKDKEVAMQSLSCHATNSDGKNVEKQAAPPIANIRLKSTHSVAFEHDANEGVDLITISNIYEDEDDNNDPIIILRFHDRNESKIWLDKLNLALTGVHASRVIADTNWISRQGSFNPLMKERNLNLEDIMTHVQHGEEYEKASRMVKAHTFFLEKQLKKITRRKNDSNRPSLFEEVLDV
jgi:hypothetical protein